VPGHFICTTYDVIHETGSTQRVALFAKRGRVAVNKQRTARSSQFSSTDWHCPEASIPSGPWVLTMQGCSPKKEVGTPETRLRQRFLNNIGLHTRTSYTSEKFCCTEIILNCVSVSNQLQQWTNFCTNFSPKSERSGDASPCPKKWGDAVPPRPRPTTSLVRTRPHLRSVGSNPLPDLTK